MPLRLAAPHIHNEKLARLQAQAAQHRAAGKAEAPQFACNLTMIDCEVALARAIAMPWKHVSRSSLSLGAAATSALTSGVDASRSSRDCSVRGKVTGLGLQLLAATAWPALLPK
jgi:hypothetical protein